MRLLGIGILLAMGAAGLTAAEPDALAIDNTLRLRHLPYDTVLDPVLDANRAVVSYTRCGDSATWTGHYLAAEAFRYAVTGSPHALAGVRRALAGLTLLTDVTGQDLLARCAIPADAPWFADITGEEKANGVYQATLNGRPWVWIGNTSRDQYSGVFFGLGAAYDLVGDPAIRAQISALATRLLDHLMAYAWNVVMPDAGISTTFLIRPDQQLTLLQIGKRLNPARYATEYSRLAATLAVGVPVPLIVDAVDDRSSYFKFNLDFIDLFNLIRLEPAGIDRIIYEGAFAAVRSTTDNHLNPHFNMIDRALHGPNPARDAETRADLDAWLQRPRMDVFIDWRGKVKACSADQACDPLPVAARPPADFLWQSSPFLLYGGQKGNIESAGIDYLLPYWMARYYGVIVEPFARPQPHGGPFR
ncbi:MAG: hypothetical protein JST11_28945 [Acidobacteria bacterium]|nr:hypothetical protein [Acidobacteriota bacterium]